MSEARRTALTWVLLLSIISMTIGGYRALAAEDNYSFAAKSPDGSTNRAIITLVIDGKTIVDGQTVDLPWTSVHPGKSLLRDIQFGVQTLVEADGNLTCRIAYDRRGETTVVKTRTGASLQCDA